MAVGEANRALNSSNRSLFTPTSKKISPNKSMLLQFRGTLEATVAAISEEDITSPHINRKLKIAKEILSQDPMDFTWNDAYKLEKLAVYLRPSVDLEVEINKQLSALRERDSASALIYEKDVAELIKRIRDKQYLPESDAQNSHSSVSQIVTASPHPPLDSQNKQNIQPVIDFDLYKFQDSMIFELRYYLERILNDLHWKSAQRYHCRRISTSYTWKIFYTCCILIILFGFAITFVPTMHKKEYLSFVGLIIITCSGLLGAGFSVLTGRDLVVNHYTIEQLERVTGSSVILLRIGVGGVAAIIIYFFFEAGLIDGILFPNLDRLGFREIEVPKDIDTAFGKNVTECGLVKAYNLGSSSWLFGKTCSPNAWAGREERGSSRVTSNARTL